MKTLTGATALFILILLTNQVYAQSWDITGNAGTSATTNFIGTTDAKNFKIRTNNAIRVNITSDGKIGIGNFSPIFKLDVKGGSINTDSVYRIKGSTVLSSNSSGKFQIGDSNAKIGIGTSNPTSRLHVEGDAFFTNPVIYARNNYTGTLDVRAIEGYSVINPGHGTGIYGTGGYSGVIGLSYGSSSTGTSYGVYGFSDGTAGTRIGVYGAAYGGTTNWAGYFEGNGYFLGKVGIGNTTPVFKLDVKGGSINTDSVYRIGGNSVLSIKGNQNIFTGTNSGSSNTTGSWNTANGASALFNNTTGYSNTACGESTLLINTSGYENAAFGASSLRNNTIGNSNSGFGTSALYSNTEGNLNTAIGIRALYLNTTGSSNNAFGFDALTSNTTGHNNTAFGQRSLYDNSIGFSNTGFGENTLANNSTGNYNTAIGYFSDISLSNLSNATSIGNFAVVNANNKVRIGYAGITVIEGQVGFSWPSDGRFKENIKEDVKGLEFIMKLQPVSYNFNRLKYARHIREHLTEENEVILIEQSKNRSVGFIAQDVEKIIQQTGFTAFDAVHAPSNETDNYSVGYAEFVVPLVKAVQELSAKNEMQDKLIEELVAEINNLKSGTKTSVINNSKSGTVSQNSPNPFSSASEIKFQLPAQYKSAQMIITDENGKQLKAYGLHSSPLVINAGELSAGVYTYSLVIDGLPVDSKQMILTN